MNEELTIQQETDVLISRYAVAMGRWDAASAISDFAQQIMRDESNDEAARVRSEVKRLSDALALNQAKLKDMGKLVGRPPDKLTRKPRKRKDAAPKDAPVEHGAAV